METTKELNKRLAISPSTAASLSNSRAGQTWTPAEEGKLRYMFAHRADMAEMCVLFERTRGGIIGRLEHLKLIRDTGWSNFSQDRYEHRQQTNPAQTIQTTQITQEQPMTQERELMIETKTFINGVDAKGLNDTTLFTLIADEVKAIDALEALPVKSKKLAAHIAKRRKQVDEVTTYLDER